MNYNDIQRLRGFLSRVESWRDTSMGAGVVASVFREMFPEVDAKDYSHGYSPVVVLEKPKCICKPDYGPSNYCSVHSGVAAPVSQWWRKFVDDVTPIKGNDGIQ